MKKLPFKFYFHSLLFIAVVCATLSSCAVLDSHNIIGRVRVPLPMETVPVPSPDETWKQETLALVWNTINEKYYDPRLNGVDWNAVRTLYTPQILAAKTDDEYWEQLDHMTGELRDSHTRVHSPKQVAQLRANQVHSLGIGFTEMQGVLVVTSVHPDSDAWWAGVRNGMTIKSIDSEPALAVYHRTLEASRHTSTAWARRRGAVRKIVSGDVGTQVSMIFSRKDGTEISAPIKRRIFHTPPELVHRILPSGFGYVRFSNFTLPLQQGIMNAIDKMKDAPGMIVDLRGNGGGSSAMAQQLAAKFLNEKQKLGRLLTRTGKPVSLFFVDLFEMEPEFKGDKEKAYDKPLVILTNEGTASAAEIFSGALQTLKRATIIGQHSCGCLLGFLGYADLPGGGQLAYSEIGFVGAKGEKIEGQGLQPDRGITLTREDYVLNRDRVLEAAEIFLKENSVLNTQPVVTAK